jgi:hypothetical protein
MEGREMEWKRLVDFVLLGSSDLQEYAILLVRVSLSQSGRVEALAFQATASASAPPVS